MADMINRDWLGMLNSAPNCMLVVSADFLIISVSDYFFDNHDLIAREILGYELNMVLSKIFNSSKLKSHRHYLKIETWLKNHLTKLSDKQTKTDFYRTFPGVSYNAVIGNDNSNCVIISFTDALLDGLIPDISERESTFQCMADETDILISIVDDCGKLEYRNPAWERLMGGAMPVEGRFKWDAFIHDEDLESFQTLLYDSIVKRAEFSSEFRIQDQFGQYRWLRVEGMPRTSRQGRFIGYICTGIEITQIKDQIENLDKINKALIDAHAQLEAKKEELEAAFDAGEMGSCSLNITTLKAEMSPRYRQLYGLPLTGDINWEMVTEAVDPDYKEEVNQVLIRAATLGAPVDSTYPIRHLVTGEKKWMRVIGKVRKDFDNKPQSVYAVVVDVTKRMEEESRKNRFIAMVSHELKTPLTSISGYIQLLEHKATKNEDIELTRVYGKVRNQVKKMERMIGGFLNISRLESGNFEINRKPFDIADLLHQIKTEFGTEISTHHIRSGKTQSIIVNADWDRLEMVLHNLLSNALKYSPPGSEVLIDYDNLGNDLRVTVRDQGRGIRDDEKNKLFDRYFKSDVPQEQTIAGFGIGLFLCAEIIGLHGGTIWGESRQDGPGAVFGFSLPKSDYQP